MYGQSSCEKSFSAFSLEKEGAREKARKSTRRKSYIKATIHNWIQEGDLSVAFCVFLFFKPDLAVGDGLPRFGVRVQAERAVRLVGIDVKILVKVSDIANVVEIRITGKQ